MCLITKQKRARISLRRIPIYKILVKFRRTGKYVTPYQCFLVKRNKTYKNQKAPEVINRRDGRKSIMGGFFHAFLSCHDAEFECNIINKVRDINRYECVIVSGYIPPFTKYYIGDFGDIAARKIHYN